MIEELIAETISRIEAIEGRERRRSTVAKIHFDHAVRHILIELWKQGFDSPVHERQVSHRFLVAVTQLSVDCVLPQQLSKAYWDVSFIAVGAVGTAENVSGEFLGHLIAHG